MNNKDNFGETPEVNITVGGTRGIQNSPSTYHGDGNQNGFKKTWTAIINVLNSGNARRTRVVLAVLAILLTGVGVYGARDVLHLSSAGTYPDPTNFNSPYGFTLRDSTSCKLSCGDDSELVSEYKALNVHWIRDQMKWSWTETQPGVYNWAQVDQQVAQANQAGIHMVYVIQAAPSWHNSEVCSADGTHFRFGPNDVSQFATALAQRYNGKNGHGYIDAYEIGNEDFDNYWNVSIGSASLQCRDPKYYVADLKAGYQAIKAQSPSALVGMFGMWYEDKTFEANFINGMFQLDPTIGNYMDYGNFHFYNGSNLPDQPAGANHPTFDERWQIMHNAFETHGVHNKPIWVTEVGWDTSNPTVQNQALQYVMDHARQSGVVQKVFWYTINWDPVKDIQPGDRNSPATFNPTPAFNTYQAYVAQYPTWGNSGGTGPTVSLSASPASVMSGQSSMLTWSSTNATACNASGSWSGSKPLTGTASTGTLTSSATYVLTCTGNGGTSSGTASVTVSTQQGSASFNHIFTIVMENHDNSSIVGSSQAPYINSLISQYGFASNYHAVGLPSEPNYLGMTAGSTFGRTNDCLVNACPDNATNIADELEQGGFTWKAYMESMGSACSTTDSTLYRQKHNPFVYYTDIFTNKTRCNSHVVDYNQLAGDLSGTTPNYVFVTPNMINDMHDGTIAQGDSWLKSNVPAILNSAAWKNNGLLVITWDSALDAQGITAPSPTILISPLSKAGFKSSTQESHYSLLRTIEDNWKLNRLGSSANATAMTEYFNGSTGGNAPTVSLSASPTSVNSGGGSTLTWSSTNVTSCTASGSWSGSKSTSGTSSTGGLTASATYTLACSGAGGSTSASTSVTVGGTPPPSGSAVKLDTSSHSSSNGNGVASLNWSHMTTSQPNALLVVNVSMGEPSSLSYKVGSVTYNGKSLKKLASEASPGGGCWCNLELWYTTAPAPGTHIVTVSVSGGNHPVVASAVTYYNVLQGTPLGTLAVKKGYATSSNPVISTSVTSTPNQAVLNVWATDNNQSFAPGSGQTQLWNANSNNPAGFASNMAGGVTGNKSSTPVWNITSGKPQPFNYADIGVAFNYSN